jgi:hypothetical protein
VKQRGKETSKLKLTNNNYKYYNGLESDKQVVGPNYISEAIQVTGLGGL